MKSLPLHLLRALAFACACVVSASAQGETGRPGERPPPKPAPSEPRRILSPAKPPTRPARTTRSTRPPAEAHASRAPEGCHEAAELLVRCGEPGCQVSVGGSFRGLTNDKGELLVEQLHGGSHKVEVSKQGYRGNSLTVSLRCGASEAADLSLRINPVRIRIRTTPPEVEVFVNDPPVAVGRSNADGLLEYTAETPSLLVQARKAGYFEDSRRVRISPDASQREIALNLKPIPAQLSLSASAAGARVRVGKSDSRPLTTEPLALAPGLHRLVIDALGYTPVALEVTAAPGESLKRTITLERLPVVELVAQAEAALAQRAYEDVLALCAYAFEAEPRAAAAHRLAGLTHLARQEFARAGHHLAQALAGGEVVQLPVRRHSRESFDLLKGHDSCEGWLVFGKTEVEYRGRQVASENFRVPYAQVQVAGLQLKKSVAAFLATKVSDGRGKRQDYNFYSFDKELTQAGRPYLEMLHALLRPH
jgi:hypothetical protein